MENQKKRHLGAAAAVLLWAALAAWAWLAPDQAVSDAERRQLAQMPGLSLSSVASGSFMADFEDYSLDQFPLRDAFRQVKALFHYYVLGQKDNNGIYLADGYAVKQEYPLNEDSVDHALERLNAVYEAYLADSGAKIYMAVVPDKGYYLGQAAGQLTMDYGALFAAVREGMPWAEHVDLTDTLDARCYYRTDTHWRQEKLLTAAQRLCESMGVTGPRTEEYTVTALERPFYGVYYGQAALPMEPETMYILESGLLDGCTVTNFETGKTSRVYDLDKLDSRDLYDVYLSGAVSLLTIENPQGQPGKELVVFRDSFGSSMIPLLVQDYEKVTVIDIRYITPSLLGQYVEFQGKDVLFLYSTLVLNNSSTLK